MENSIISAGKIAIQVREYAKSIIKKNMSLLEIAEKIENKIIELGGKPAFPTNLSINEIAAHYTPLLDDNKLAQGLLKIDLGVQINGYTADTAFSLDLENNDENKSLIDATQLALEKAISFVKEKKEESKLGEIGKIIEETIRSQKFSPIINLTGHSIEQYDLHSGITIPNINTRQNFYLGTGIFAIEPFATNGNGKVKNGKLSSIYCLINNKNPRSPIAREIFHYIAEEYSSLPFCERWLVKKFGTKAKIALKQLKEIGNLHQFEQLIEEGTGKVAQAEHTILVNAKEVIQVT